MKPLIERDHPAGLGGTQALYRFPNGYGASVIQTPFSYGGDEGLKELAVIKYNGEGINDYKLCYDTEITDEVLGCLSDKEVEVLLRRIEALEGEQTHGY